MKRYLTPGDVKMRLDGSVCRYKGEPVLVSALPDMNVMCHFIGSRKKDVIIDSSDPDLDISSVPLGYCNEEHLPYYTRAPFRQQKQGVSSHNLMIKHTDGRVERMRGGFANTPFAEMIAGDYPKFSTALDRARAGGGFKGCAFHRRYALGRTPNPSVFKMLGRGNVLGVFVPKTEVTLLKPEYNCKMIIDELSSFTNIEVLENATD